MPCYGVEFAWDCVSAANTDLSVATVLELTAVDLVLSRINSSLALK